MKFLCVDCDVRMMFDERQVPGDGTFAAAFRCPRCERRVALLANPTETQLVQALGVQVGGRAIDEQPLELVRGMMVGRDDAFNDEEGQTGQESGEQTSSAPSAPAAPPAPVWSADARDRLARVPNFVRGMVKGIYSDWASQHGIAEITPAMMDQARRELGLEEM